MNRSRTCLSMLSLAVALAAAGCHEAPTAPHASDPPAPEVKTPVSATITSIIVTKFPAKKSDGSDWDLSLIAADRRPDLYVTLTASGRAPDYVSSTFSNVITGGSYVFTYSKDSSSGKLPATLPYDDSRRVYVMDEDFGSADDQVGWITVNLPRAYQGDNGGVFGYSFTDSGNRLTVWVQGTWNY